MIHVAEGNSSPSRAITSRQLVGIKGTREIQRRELMRRMEEVGQRDVNFNWNERGDTKRQERRDNR